MKSSVLRILCLVGMFTLALGVPRVHAQLVLYDDFSGPQLDAARWFGQQLEFGEGGGAGLEIERSLRPGLLVMSIRALGGTLTTAVPHFSENALFFRNPASIREISVDLGVVAYELTGCAAGDPASFAVARTVLPLFSDGPFGTTTGDVIAFAEVRRSSDAPAPANVFDVVGYVIHRTLSGDSSFGFLQLGTVRLRQLTSLRVKWDQAASLVEFQLGAAAPQTITYVANVAGLPNAPGKLLGALGLAAPCAGGPAPVASVTAHFDNVRVNP